MPDLPSFGDYIFKLSNMCLDIEKYSSFYHPDRLCDESAQNTGFKASICCCLHHREAILFVGQFSHFITILFIPVHCKEDRAGSGLCEHGEVDPLVEAVDSLTSIYISQSPEYTFVFGHQVFLIAAIVTLMEGYILWRRVLSSSRGWKIPTT